MLRNFCSSQSPRCSSMSVGIEYSELSVKSKFHSKYLNSEATVIVQFPLNGTGAVVIKDTS